MLSVAKIISQLISVGTAICGGSAIAAMGPVVGASDEEMSVSIGTIFILNAIGLVVFPPLGHAFGSSQEQFGLWAALAIHDTSSVVGAGTKYGDDRAHDRDDREARARPLDRPAHDRHGASFSTRARR